jgi:hypothetical protein
MGLSETHLKRKCPYNKTYDGYILGEIYSFCPINTFVRSDRMYLNTGYNFYVDEEWGCLCKHCPQEEYSSRKHAQ